jgi:hypothetical protein
VTRSTTIAKSAASMQETQRRVVDPLSIADVHRNDKRMVSKRWRGGKAKGNTSIVATDVTREASRAEERPPRRVAVMSHAVFARVPRKP